MTDQHQHDWQEKQITSLPCWAIIPPFPTTMTIQCAFVAGPQPYISYPTTVKTKHGIKAHRRISGSFTPSLRRARKMTIRSAKTLVRYPSKLPTRAARFVRPTEPSEKLYGGLESISELIFPCITPDVAPKAKMKAACVDYHIRPFSTLSLRAKEITYNDDIRECHEEERPFEVCPIGGLVLW